MKKYDVPTDIELLELLDTAARQKESLSHRCFSHETVSLTNCGTNWGRVEATNLQLPLSQINFSAVVTGSRFYRAVTGD